MISEPTLHDALDFAAEKIVGIGATSMDAPTPCAEWSLREVLNHLITTMDLSTRGLSGEAIESGAMDPARTAATDVGESPADAFAATAERARTIFADPDIWTRTVNAPFPGLEGGVAASLLATDMVAHGWDIARASGQDATIPEGLADELHAFTSGFIPEAMRGRFFAPQVPVGPDATSTERLVAFLGREP